MRSTRPAPPRAATTSTGATPRRPPPTAAPLPSRSLPNGSAPASPPSRPLPGGRSTGSTTWRAVPSRRCTSMSPPPASPRWRPPCRTWSGEAGDIAVPRAGRAVVLWLGALRQARVRAGGDRDCAVIISAGTNDILNDMVSQNESAGWTGTAERGGQSRRCKKSRQHGEPARQSTI
jgi:hypothetical protein